MPKQPNSSGGRSETPGYSKKCGVSSARPLALNEFPPARSWSADAGLVTRRGDPAVANPRARFPCTRSMPAWRGGVGGPWRPPPPHLYSARDSVPGLPCPPPRADLVSARPVWNRSAAEVRPRSFRLASGRMASSALLFRGRKYAWVSRRPGGANGSRPAQDPALRPRPSQPGVAFPVKGSLASLAVCRCAAGSQPIRNGPAAPRQPPLTGLL